MMQNCLTVSLCVLATFVLIEAKPMYSNGGGYGGYNGGEYQGYRADYSSQSRFSVDQYRGGQGGGGYGGGGYVSGGGSSHPGGHSYGYMPEHCPNCKIRNYGNGDYNTNTFNIPREAYN